jgi:NAD(P)-dependent dehydrogenase (short-subunit alcohol dehydrogenase family)
VPSLKARTVLIIGRGSGIAWAIALAVIAEGGRVIAANLAPDGSFLFMSGATALKPSPGMLAVAATNAAVDAITAGLAVELAPVRVNAIAPGTIDTGAYDALGEERKAALFSARSATNPARRIGKADEIAAMAVAVLTNGFLTGVSIPVDGGEHLV